MPAARLVDLPDPPTERSGWPWTEETIPLPATRSDGSPWPKITIVTPSYNQGAYIEETVRSILLQGYPNLEYIVMDGGSTDQTVGILKRYEPWIDHWESTPDKGQSDAINKGLSKASGYWFQNINSDDIMLPCALERIGQSPLGKDAICGDVEEFQKNGSLWYVKNKSISVQGLLSHRNSPEDLNDRFGQVRWHQPGVFLRTEHLRNLNGYRDDLQYAFDFHLTCRFIESFPNFFYLDEPIVRFRIHDDAKSTAWRAVYDTERIKARELLSRDLCTRQNRRDAKRAALSMAARRHVALYLNEGSIEDRRSVIALVKMHPRLLFDRMVLGFLRRILLN